MKWTFKATRLIQVDADDPSEAMEKAQWVAEHVVAHEGVRLEIVTEGEDTEARPLFPQYSREFLEKLYSDQSAALELAVRDRLPDAPDEQILRAVLSVIERAQGKATRATSMRALMNVEGTKQ